MKALIWAFGTAFLFSLVDVILYPRAEKGGWVSTYRYIQAGLGVGFLAAAGIVAGWQAPLAAALIWWTWGCNMMFYGLMGLYTGRNVLAAADAGGISWAWWTPVGLLTYWAQRRKPILSRGILVAQTTVGVVVAMAVALG